MNIVVVGGGFGGVKAALELARRRVGRITLITEHKYFLNRLTSYSALTGQQTERSAVALGEIFKPYKNIKLVQDKITRIDAKEQTVTGAKKLYSYDKLILSPGFGGHFRATNNLARHSYGDDIFDGIGAFGTAFHDSLVADKNREINCAVVGGGATGVGLVSALDEYAKRIIKSHNISRTKLNLIILESQNRLLPGLSKSASRKITRRLAKSGVKVMLGKKINQTGRSHFVVGDDKIDIDMAVWTCGGQNSPLLTEHPEIFRLSKAGRVLVNQYLSAYPNVFVIGDSAKTPFSGLAPAAIDNAIFVAKHLDRLSKNQPLKAYKKPRNHPLLTVPMSRFWAYGEWGGVYVAGFWGSLLRRFAELNNYCHFLTLRKAYISWRNQRKIQPKCRLCQKS